MSNLNHRRKNPVARVFKSVKRPATHKDKTKYSRKTKYRGEQ